MAALISKLTLEQKKVARSTAKKKIVIAGPGSGKTTTLLALAMEYLRKDSSRKVLFLTYSNRLAKEVRQKIKGETEIVVKTLHAFGHNLIRENSGLFGYTDDVSVIEKSVLKRHTEQIFKEVFDGLGVDAELKYALRKFAINSMTENLNIRRQLEKQDSKLMPWCEQLERVKKRVRKIIREQNVLSFNDQISGLNYLLSNSEAVLRKLSETYQAVLVDEFQDLKKTQYKIVCKLANAIENTVIAGDDAQSIYEYKGAMGNGLVEFGNEFKDAVQFKLTQSHRCPKPIIKMANAVRNTIEGVIPAELSSTKSGNSALYFKCRSADKQDAEIIKLIRHLVEYRELQYSDITVLGRLNGHLFTVYQPLCLAEIPCLLGNMDSFAQICENAKLLLSILDGKTSCFGPLLSNFDIEVTHKVELALGRGEHVSEKSLEYLLKHVDRAKATDDIEEKLRLVQKILKHYMPDSTNKMIRPHFNQIRHRASQCESLKEVIEQIDDYRNKNTNCVSVQSINQSKGLEYKAVIVIDMVDGLFPDRRAFTKSEENDSITPTRQFNSERKLFYVAVSRAMEYLFLFGRPSNMFDLKANKNKGQTTECSLFTEEILSCCKLIPV